MLLWLLLFTNVEYCLLHELDIVIVTVGVVTNPGSDIPRFFVVGVVYDVVVVNAVVDSIDVVNRRIADAQATVRFHVRAGVGARSAFGGADLIAVIADFRDEFGRVAPAEGAVLQIVEGRPGLTAGLPPTQPPKYRLK